jgi:tryptophan-rich sensory protein
MGDVSGKHPTLITPASYAFSIWGIIYLSLVAYAIVQLLPSERNKQVYKRLVWPLIATSLLSITWLISFSYEQMLLSVVIISGMLVTAIVLFGLAKEAVFRQQASAWITIPFGLYVGWLSVATITNIAVWLKDTGWQGGSLGEPFWTVCMIVVALLLALLISLRFKDSTFPLVIAWATFAIFSARQGENQLVANAALITACITGLWVIGFGIWFMRKPHPQKAWQP